MSKFIVFILASVMLSGCFDAEENQLIEKRTYSEQDWQVYEACKARVYQNVNNDYDYSACSEMLKHKDALKKYGANHSYNYWLNK